MLLELVHPPGRLAWLSDPGLGLDSAHRGWSGDSVGLERYGGWRSPWTTLEVLLAGFPRPLSIRRAGLTARECAQRSI